MNALLTSHLERTLSQYQTHEWAYSSDKKYRWSMRGKRLVVQKKKCFSESSQQRVLDNAQQGVYDYDDLRIIGSGNSFLIVGWETIAAQQ